VIVISVVNKGAGAGAKGRREKTQATRSRIIEASFELFQAYGMETVTVQDICAKAEVSNGTFYHNFESKDNLQLLYRCECERKVVERLKNQNAGGATEKLRAFVRAVCEINKGGSGGAADSAAVQESLRIYVISRMKGNIPEEFYRNRYDHTWGVYLHELFREGVVTGEFRADMDAGDMAALFLNSLLGYCIQYQMLPGDSWESFCETYEKQTDLFLKLVLASN